MVGNFRPLLATNRPLAAGARSPALRCAAARIAGKARNLGRDGAPVYRPARARSEFAGPCDDRLGRVDRYITHYVVLVILDNRPAIDIVRVVPAGGLHFVFTGRTTTGRPLISVPTTADRSRYPPHDQRGRTRADRPGTPQRSVLGVGVPRWCGLSGLSKECPRP
jgi:hypothetical protein